MSERGLDDQVQLRRRPFSLLGVGALFILAAAGLLLAASLLSGCAMDKPVSIVVEKGLIQVEGVGLVSGEKVRYRSGLLEEGEAAATFDGKANGFPAEGPGPAPAPKPKPPE